MSLNNNENIANCPETNFKVIFTLDEKIKCLEEIIARFKKILYVYDKSQEEETKYDYKVYCGGILIYVSSSNMLFDGELVNVIVNLNAIINNNFDKAQIKRIVFESKNQLDHLLKKYKTALVQQNSPKKEG